MEKKVVLSLSGGLDSTCLLMTYLAGGATVKAYSFMYGQKHSIELEKVAKNIKFLQEKGFKVEHHSIDIMPVFNESSSSLCGDGGAIPEGHYEDENMKSTVVENRNVIFSSIIFGKALSWAKHTDSNVVISLGIHAGDHAIYPDCTQQSQQAAEYLFKISNWESERVSYVAPFVNVDKGEVLRFGLEAMKQLNFTDDEINFVLGNTHTCYNPNEQGESCGKCGSCTERLEAFEHNHIKDPVPYQQ